MNFKKKSIKKDKLRHFLKKHNFFLSSIHLALLVSLFPVFFISAKNNNNGKDLCCFHHILSEAFSRLHLAYIAFRNYNIYLRKINVDALQ